MPVTERLKSNLLVVELWGLGDLVIATPFLQAASEKYAVTLLAKPFAKDLQVRFWPAVEVFPFVAPWTAFRRKYRLLSWPWREIFRLRRLAQPRFEIGLSARWDPRDHLLLQLLRAKRRLGFPRLQSQMFLTEPLARPEPTAHRQENWRVLAGSLGLTLPAREQPGWRRPRREGEVLVHSGAGQPVRVWPLERCTAPGAAVAPGELSRADRLRSGPERLVAGGGRARSCEPAHGFGVADAG